MGLHGRAINDAVMPHYWFYTRMGESNPQVWHNEHQMDTTKPVIIAESVFDMAAIFPVWPNVITPRSAKMKPEMFERLAGVSHVVTWFDGDKAGDMARQTIDASLSAKVLHVIPTEGQDAGSMAQEEIQSRWDYIANSSVFSLL
jgi:DNA primase